MSNNELSLSIERSKSIDPELVLEVATENLEKSRRKAELTNPEFVADHAKTRLQEFTFVVCGAPRTGKSTLINAILNKDLAPTKSGSSAVTLETNCYTLQGNCPEKTDEENQTFRINIWDTKGITTWDTTISNIIKEKTPMCLILCSSPGSFAKDDVIRPLINQCITSKVFVALVCTNQWNDSDEKRTKVIEEFHDLLKVGHCEIFSRRITSIF
jgi:GTPase SAR1 family protein